MSKTYGLGEEAARDAVAAPELPYRPRNPRSYNPRIALIACGNITVQHLTGYRKAGYDVVALCDPDLGRAEARRREFYPDAAVYADHRDVLSRDDVEVVDVAAHPSERIPIVREALLARKHVLSQKPFVLDLATGHELVDLADRMNVKLAVNQNGRFAPHFAYVRHAIEAGLLGTTFAAHLSVHWNHNWIKGTAFEDVRHLVLYDFAIHWFDIVTVFLRGREPKRVYASCAYAPGQRVRPPMLAQAMIEYDGAQASLAFDADCPFGPLDRAYVAGTAGSAICTGPSLMEQSVVLYTAAGMAVPRLEGAWFPDGFLGSMAELLCAIEEDREPFNSARDNLRGLALCFAAVAAAESHQPQTPGSVTSLPS